jgi:RNA polymerase sigma factor (sigma-70 family)
MIDVDALYREQRATVVRCAARVSRLHADDAAQVAFLRLHERRERFSGDNPVGWLVTVAKHEALRLAKRDRTVSLDAEPVDGPRGELVAPASTEREAEARAVLAAIGGLRSGQRTALTGRMLGLSYVEVAEATGRTYTWTNRHVSEGRRALAAAA